MHTIFLVLISLLSFKAIAQEIDSEHLRNLNIRIHTKNSDEQLRYIFYKAKVVKTLQNIKEWNNRNHMRYQGQINSYEDLRLLQSSVQLSLDVIKTDAFGYDHNSLIKGIITLLPTPKAKLFSAFLTKTKLLTRMGSFDSPGATSGKVLEWLEANGIKNELSNMDIDNEFIAILNQCDICLKSADRHFKDKFKFKVTEDHFRYSHNVQDARELEQTQNEVGDLKEELETNISSVKDILLKVKENQEKSIQLAGNLKEFINDSDKLSTKEKAELSKKLDQGQIASVVNSLAQKEIEIQEAEKLKLKELQDEYNQNLLKINEARVYSQILTTVIGFKDPEAQRKAQTLFTTALNLAEMTMKFNNPDQSGVQISAALLTGNYIMAGLQLFSAFSGGGNGQAALFKNMMKALADISRQIKELGEQMNDRFDNVDRKLRAIHSDMILLFKKTHENQEIMISQSMSIMRDLDRLYNFSNKHYQMVESSFKYLLSEDFDDCKYDIDLSLSSSWTKQRNQECIREFIQYSQDLSRQEVFNKASYIVEENNLETTLNSEKYIALNKLRYLTRYAEENFGMQPLVEPLPNPIMFDMGVSYFSQAYNKLEKDFGPTLTVEEKAGLELTRAKVESLISQFKTLENRITSNGYQLLNNALDHLEDKIYTFKEGLKLFQKSFIRAKLGPKAKYNFIYREIEDISIDLDNDSLTMNKCKSQYTGSFTHIDFSNLNKLKNIPIELNESMHFVKNIPDHVKAAAKLGLGKIKFCYEISGVLVNSLEGINNYYQRTNANRRLSPSSLRELAQHLMGGILAITIKTLLVPSSNRIKELRHKFFKDPQFKALLTQRLRSLKELFKDNSFSVNDVIKAPIVVDSFSDFLDYRDGIAQIDNMGYFYMDCSSPKNECLFSQNGTKVTITYNKFSNDPDEHITKKIIEAKYRIQFAPTKDFLNQREKERISKNNYFIQWYREMDQKYLLPFADFSPFMFSNRLDVSDEVKKIKENLTQDFLDLLSQCLSDSQNLCVRDQSQNLVNASTNLQESMQKLEEANFMTQSFFNLSFYDSLLVDKKSYNEFNHKLSYVSNEFISDFLKTTYPELIFDFSLSKYEGTDHFDDMVIRKREMLNSLKSNEHKPIFDFNTLFMEIKL